MLRVCHCHSQIQWPSRGTAGGLLYSPPPRLSACAPLPLFFSADSGAVCCSRLLMEASLAALANQWPDIQCSSCGFTERPPTAMSRCANNPVVVPMKTTGIVSMEAGEFSMETCRLFLHCLEKEYVRQTVVYLSRIACNCGHNVLKM